MSPPKNSKSSKDVEGIGQGELYSPDHAIKVIDTKNHNNLQNEENDATMMGMVKDRLIEKLAAASVSSDALENAKEFVEMVIRDVASAAQGLTKEALQRIKSHLADVLPSLSPSLTSKMVDDAEKEAASGGGRDKDREMERANCPQVQQQKGKVSKL